MNRVRLRLIVKLFEEIRRKVMRRIISMREKVEVWDTSLPLDVMKYLDVRQEEHRGLYGGNREFEVIYNCNMLVDLNKRKCSCNDW